LSKVTTRVAGQTIEEAGKIRLLPVVLDVGDEARHHHQVDRAVAECVIGDVDVAAFGVLRDRLHGSPPPTRRDYRPSFLLEP
jgi:hypothetical protein